MPLRRLAGHERTREANWQLASLLAFVAGVVDVTGYLALRQFTSHMTGTVAAIAASFPWRDGIILRFVATLLAFLIGAATCACLINWKRRRQSKAIFALPLLCEAATLAAVAIPGISQHTSALLVALAFAMGMQNAIITKISSAEIRTTHLTDILTDIGIELGRGLYWNKTSSLPPITAHRERMLLLSLLVVMFFIGGVMAAVVFPHAGFLTLAPLAVLLAMFTVVPIAIDLRT